METTARKLEEEISNSETPILVEFWSSWCLPCQIMAPVLEEIKKEYEGRVRIVKINSDLNPVIASKYEIRGLPTFVFFKEGKEVRREVSAKPKKELNRIIDELLTN